MIIIILAAAVLGIIDIQWVKEKEGVYRLYYVVAERWIDQACQKKIDWSKPGSPEAAEKCHREEERFIIPATKDGKPITAKMSDAEARRESRKARR